MCVLRPPRVAFAVLALIGLVLSGCPGALEDPDRFDEPDATPSDAAAGDAGGDT
ncbi:MAG: hypothetical protein IT377_22090 [Polyangiaceae bacterium]|nr:hypothetical protein [Polyangiaceae bacterium]